MTIGGLDGFGYCEIRFDRKGTILGPSSSCQVWDNETGLPSDFTPNDTLTVTTGCKLTGTFGGQVVEGSLSRDGSFMLGLVGDESVQSPETFQAVKYRNR